MTKHLSLWQTFRLYDLVAYDMAVDNSVVAFNYFLGHHVGLVRSAVQYPGTPSLLFWEIFRTNLCADWAPSTTACIYRPTLPYRCRAMVKSVLYGDEVSRKLFNTKARASSTFRYISVRPIDKFPRLVCLSIYHFSTATVIASIY